MFGLAAISSHIAYDLGIKVAAELIQAAAADPPQHEFQTHSQRIQSTTTAVQQQ